MRRSVAIDGLAMSRSTWDRKLSVTPASSATWRSVSPRLRRTLRRLAPIIGSCSFIGPSLKDCFSAPMVDRQVAAAYDPSTVIPLQNFMPEPHEPNPLPEPGKRRSWWLREALRAEGDPAPTPPLNESL